MRIIYFTFISLLISSCTGSINSLDEKDQYVLRPYTSIKEERRRTAYNELFVPPSPPSQSDPEPFMSSDKTSLESQLEPHFNGYKY